MKVVHLSVCGVCAVRSLHLPNVPLQALISVTPDEETYDEEDAAFCLEMLLRIVLENRYIYCLECCVCVLLAVSDLTVVCLQGPRVLRLADGPGPPLPPVRSRHGELLPGGAGRGGPAETRHPPAAPRRHQLAGTEAEQ